MPAQSDAIPRSVEPALPDGDRWLETWQVAEMSGMSEKVLKDYRCRRTHLGPPFHRLPRRRTRYRLSEVRQWLADREASL